MVGSDRADAFADRVVAERGDLAQVVDLERTGELIDRRALRPRRDDLPTGERGHEPGLDERALADPRRADDRDERLELEAIRERFDFAFAADVPLRVALGVRGEPAIGSIGRGGRARRLVAAEYLIAKPVPQLVVAALEAVRARYQACTLPAGTREHEQLGRVTGNRDVDLREWPQRDERAAVRVDDHRPAVGQGAAERDVLARSTARARPRFAATVARHDELIIEHHRERAQHRRDRRQLASDRLGRGVERRVGQALGQRAFEHRRERIAAVQGRDELGQRVGVGQLREWLGELASERDPTARREPLPAQLAQQRPRALGVTAGVADARSTRERDDADPPRGRADDRAQRLARLMRVLGGVVARDRVGERLRRDGQVANAQLLVELGQVAAAVVRAGRVAKRLRELEHVAVAVGVLACERALQYRLELAGEAVAERLELALAVSARDLGERAPAEREPAGERLVRERAERVLIRGGPRAMRIDPHLGRHVRWRSEHRAGLGRRRRRCGRAGRRRRARRRGVAERRGLGRHRPGDVRVGRVRRGAGRIAVDRTRDAEIEQLRHQPAGARDHHDVVRLQIAMDDALLVRGVNDLADPLEQRHEPVERHRSLRLQHRPQRRTAHPLHRDPQDAVGLGAERVDVRGVRMVEARRELGLAQEPLDPQLLAFRSKDLDDRLAAQRRLLGEIDIAVAAATDHLAQHEPAELAAGERSRRVGGRRGRYAGGHAGRHAEPRRRVGRHGITIPRRARGGRRARGLFAVRDRATGHGSLARFRDPDLARNARALAREWTTRRDHRS